MSLSDRDRKLLLIIVPMVVVAAYWFLLLAPKREAASEAAADATEQTERRDAARALADTAQGAKTDFASDYAEIVRLGKAIPSNVDMPSLMVQLDRAAAGTGIRFTRIATGERQEAAAAAPAPAPSGGAPASGGAPVEAGGEAAQSAPGTATEAANETAQDANQQAAAAEQSGVDPADTQTSESSGGGLPVGGGTAAPGGTATTGTSPAGLETVPLELEFVGNFFNLADFFHDIKRFVRVANQNVVVSGRLITVDGVRFSSATDLFPRITAEVTATVYLTPKAQGATAGATPSGPAATPGAQPTPASDTAPATPTPAATATPTATATP
jgi:Tfp pilus assembly protein PilO